MSLARTKYGVEYDPGKDDDGSSGVGWILIAALVVAAVSFAYTFARRMAASDGGEPPAPAVATSVEPAPPGAGPRQTHASGGETRAQGASPVDVDGIARRSPRVRSLLLRLDEAAKKGDLEMQVSTIERIRSLPPGEATDIAAELLPRLGELNWRWLFELKNPQWVDEVIVKSGDTASRIARENGSTILSLAKLNPGTDLDRLVAGRKLSVMKHPRVNIVVYKRLRAVDVFLNGKLFKRYLLPDDSPEVRCAPGDYKTPASVKDFFRRTGVALSPADADEIDILAPRGTPLNVTAS